MTEASPAEARESCDSYRIDALLRWARDQLQTQAGSAPYSEPMPPSATAPTIADQSGCIAESRLEADLLLCAAAKLRRTDLIAWPERMLSDSERTGFEQMIRRRCAGEPIAYILGKREFRGLPLHVSPATLIPRPETELLVDWALAHDPPTPTRSTIRCADLGTGSGAIAIAIALERPDWQVLAIDRSTAALDMAAANCQRLGAECVRLIQSDWLNAIAERSLDLILANPPYVVAQDPHLRHGDLRFEPTEALAAGADGLAAIRRIVAALPGCLVPGGRIAIEHGWNQGAEVRALLATTGLTAIETHRDLSRHERFTSACYPG